LQEAPRGRSLLLPIHLPGLPQDLGESPTSQEAPQIVPSIRPASELNSIASPELQSMNTMAYERPSPAD
jgi:hypothetical protein